MRDAEFIRVFAEFGFSHRQLANEYGRHPDTIRNILHYTSHDPARTRESRRNKNRKLADEHVLHVREWTTTCNFGEQKISRLLRETFGVEVSRSTVRQVMQGLTYQDVR